MENIKQKILSKFINSNNKSYYDGVEDVIEFIFSNYKVAEINNKPDKSNSDKLNKSNNQYCQCKIPNRDTGYSYCQRCNKQVSDARMRFFVEKDEMFKISINENETFNTELLSINNWLKSDEGKQAMNNIIIKVNENDNKIIDKLNDINIDDLRKPYDI